eukprot:CAMPEP_0201894738 /NCGR_PEP_ID=MMETSP0902-20130614/41287_1 /ASSEMBLY_ACC=CAM_ASM_000551 /TAXON_ID=420261 /ORGANISM="Thalassiosira antarctica, Strain CCMP982" /LENGTH=94 /DNA_ID=CAMNT_0048426871 /DNA_START=88 /DNA_END=368 /DNA_ORIENTATION=+
MEHFPALLITSPLASSVMEQLRKAQTALISAVGEDNTLDLAGEDTHGLEDSPNCFSPPLPNTMTSFLLEDNITVWSPPNDTSLIHLLDDDCNDV